MVGVEADAEIQVTWLSPAEVRSGDAILYPDGLPELLGVSATWPRAR